MLPIQLNTSESTGMLEEMLQLSAEVGVEGTILFGGVLVLYVIVRSILTGITQPEIPAPIVSVGSDPLFLITATLVGIFTVQAAGSLLIYHFYVGIRAESASSVALSFVGLGTGGALLSVTVPEVWGFVIGYI